MAISTLFCLLQQVLDLEFSASDAGRFIPVYFGWMNRAIGQSYARDPFALAPTAIAINPT
jgi:hypothetical protein